MKRFVLFLLAFAMTISMAGCGAAQEESVAINLDGKYSKLLPEALAGAYQDALISLENQINEYDPQGICMKIADTVSSDYKDIELLEIFCDNNYYALLAIEVNGEYYAVDPFSCLLGEETEWMSCFSGAVKQDKSLDAITESLKESYNFGGTVESVKHSSIYADSNKIESQDSENTDGQGAGKDSTYEYQTRSETQCFLYSNAWIPVGTGYPKLSDDEIDELIASDDYARIAQEISTVADCVNYFVRAGFDFGDGNVYVHQTTVSAWQTMQRRCAQCSAMSSCMHYILLGDYDEIGYIHVEGHAMMYIKQDGIYYAINPVAYVNPGEIPYYPETDTGSSADFMDIANGLVRDFNTDFVWTGVWDYSYPLSYHGEHAEYPVEYPLTIWVGNDDAVTLDDVDLSVYANDIFVSDSDIKM